MVTNRNRSWRLRGASVVGKGHLAAGSPCQDTYTTVELDSGALIVAVADGAGSATRAREASLLGVRRSAEFLAERLLKNVPNGREECESLMQEAVIASRAALDELARDNDLHNFATTLLIGMITDRWLTTIQVGDGGIVCRDGEGTPRVLSTAERGEYINETTFLTSGDYLERAHRFTTTADDISGLAMFTDGIQLLALNYPENTVHEPFFRPIFDFSEDPCSTEAELREFLECERVCERTDDDKTLVIAVQYDAH